MKTKLKIIKGGQEIYSKIIESLQEGDDYIAQNRHLFGRDDLSIPASRFQEFGLSADQATSTSIEPVIVNGVQQGEQTIYHFAKDWSVEYEDVTAQIKKESDKTIEAQIDMLCRNAYIIFKRHNRKNFSDAAVQQFFAHADAIKFYIFLDGGSPSFAKQSIQQGILSGYPSQLVSDMMTYIDQAIDLSSLE